MTTYPLPQLSVEVAWESPDAGSVTWVDVSDRVRAHSPLTITRGRSDERSDGNQPGTLSLTLDNRDGYFSVGNSGSPYYPDIIPWRRIRVQVATSSTVDLFYGFVKSWTQRWDTKDVSVVDLACVDSMALLGRRPLRSVLSETIAAGPSAYYWPLGDPDGAEAALEYSGGPSLPVVFKPGATGRVSFSAATGPPKDESSAALFDPTDGPPPQLGPIYTPALAGQRLTVEFWFTAQPSTAGVRLLQLVDWAPSGSVFLFTLAPSGSGGALFVQSYYAGSSGSAGYATTGVNMYDGRLHHVIASFGGGVRLYVDGVLVDSDSGEVLVTSGAALTVMGGGGYITTGTVGISHVALYTGHTGGVSLGFVTPHYEAGVTGFEGETTFERIERWCGWVGVDITNEGVGGGAELGHIPTAGRTVLDCVADALRTDYGSVLLASREDRAVEFYDRTTRYGAVPAVTLDTALDQVDGDLQVLMDPTYVASRVSVTTPTGTVTERNADTEATYGDLGMDVQAYPADDGYTVSLAEALGLLAASPVPRIPTVTTDLLVMALDSTEYDPTAIPEIGSPVSLVNLPPSAPDTAVDAFVEGITETVSGSSWRRTCSLSPAFPWLSTWLIEDADRGKVEAGNVIAL